MYLIRKNPFTGKHYRYDTDDHDIFTEMFNDDMHDNREIPDMSSRYTCGYCQVMFESRNQLFHHLGYMGIDIRKCNCMNMCDCAKRARMEKRRYMFQKRKRSHVDRLTTTLKSLRVL